MTLADIEKMHDEVLTPAQVAPVLKCVPYNINVQARDDPKKLGFPVIVVGTRVKIPRAGFLRFMRGEEGATNDQN